MKDLNDTIRKKTAEKFAAVFSVEGSVCPDSLVVEQASSLPTAFFTASLVKSGAIVADLTAGLGVNVFCFASKCSKVYAVEIDKTRAQALETNLTLAGIDNVEVIQEDCFAWLESSEAIFDVAYVDPVRRSASGKKLIRLEDCIPNAYEIIPLLKKKTNHLLIKASPLLDIKEAERKLRGVIGFYILEIKREVKELLIELDCSVKNHEDKDTEDASASPPFIKCVFLRDDGSNTILDVSSTGIPIEYLKHKEEIVVGGFIYEPSSSLMKAGKFGFIQSLNVGLKKLDVNAHLFYSDRPMTNLPGRIFRIKRFLNSSQLKKMRGGHYNVISRNHPAKAHELESRYKFKTSEEAYIIASTIGKEKVILEAVKI